MFLNRFSKEYREIRDLCIFDADSRLPGYSPNFEDNILGLSEYKKLPNEKKDLFKKYIKNIMDIVNFCIKNKDMPKSEYGLHGIDFETFDFGKPTSGKDVCIAFRDENSRNNVYCIYVSLENPGEIKSVTKEA